MLVRQTAHAKLNAVLAFHAVGKHVELQCADHADHDVLKAGIRQPEDLDRALLCDLLDALDELLALHRILGGDGHEVLRLKGRDTGISELFARHGDRVADGEDAGVEHADDVAGVGFVHDLALGRHHGLRLGKTHLLAGLHVVILRVALKPARADAQKGKAVAVRFIHIRLDLKDERGEIGGEHIHLAGVGNAGKGSGGHFEEALKKRLNAEVRERAAEKHGGERAAAHGVQIKLTAGAEQLHLVGKRIAPLLTDQRGQLGIVQRDGGDGGLFCVPLAGEVQDALLFAVVHAEKLLAAADRPVDGIGVDAQLALHLLAEVERIARLAVHLVDKRENGDMAQCADTEELARLRLDALCAVNDHHRAVRRHERAVGVLGEVLMTRGVENVDAEAAVLELHDG